MNQRKGEKHASSMEVSGSGAGCIGRLRNPKSGARAKRAAHSDEDNNFFELNIYGGYSDYKRIPAGLGGKIQRRHHPGRPGHGEFLELRRYRRKL